MSSRERDWMASLVSDTRHTRPHEIVQCMGDLLDRAEFAEEIACRNILERLVSALDRQPFRTLSDETRAVLSELEESRRKAG